jgi:hypothetical protein
LNRRHRHPSTTFYAQPTSDHQPATDQREQLQSLGLVSEIVAWRLRLFVPVSEDGPAILATLLARNPLIAVRSRADAA